MMWNPALPQWLRGGGHCGRIVSCVVPLLFPADGAKTYRLVRCRESKTYWKYILKETSHPREGCSPVEFGRWRDKTECAPREKGFSARRAITMQKRKGLLIFGPWWEVLDDPYVRLPWLTSGCYITLCLWYMCLPKIQLDSWTLRHKHSITMTV